MSFGVSRQAVWILALGVFLAGCGREESTDAGAGGEAVTDQAPDTAGDASVAYSVSDRSLQNMIDAYQRNAERLVERINDGSDAGALAAAARRLTHESVPIVDGFAERHADCREYLQASKAVLEQLDTISVEVIEKDYHADGALPDAEDKCYHVKDLLVHPATVVVLLRESDPAAVREDMKNEILEVLGHLDAVRDSL